ncbi:MAG: hypothetical protein ACRCYS_02100 [Beijerinckiaceae bacterium]
MKHIEHATAAELATLERWEVAKDLAKRQLREASAEKRAIAERCRARARALIAKEGKGK